MVSTTPPQSPWVSLHNGSLPGVEGYWDAKASVLPSAFFLVQNDSLCLWPPSLSDIRQTRENKGHGYRHRHLSRQSNFTGKRPQVEVGFHQKEPHLQKWPRYRKVVLINFLPLSLSALSVLFKKSGQSIITMSEEEHDCHATETFRPNI